MASRPVFIANLDGKDFVKVLIFEFEWFPGFAKVQKQKSIDSLHKSIKQMHTYEVLEISSKSKNELGINLSAFNLTFTHPKKKINVSVESAFQGSKVFEQGGPFPELYLKSARESKNFFKNKNFG